MFSPQECYYDNEAFAVVKKFQHYTSSNRPTVRVYYQTGRNAEQVFPTLVSRLTD